MYCGHEYTEANLRFAASVEPGNSAIMDYVKKAGRLRAQGLPTLPSTNGLEKRVNPFLRIRHEDVKSSAERHAGRQLPTPVEVFAEIRSWKDTFR
jgi:hydroxyacylglutathione hydrolase